MWCTLVGSNDPMLLITILCPMRADHDIRVTDETRVTRWVLT